MSEGREIFLAKYGNVNTPENHEFMRAMGSSEDHPKWGKNRSNYDRATAMVGNPTAPVEFARHALKADFFELQHRALEHPDLTHDDLQGHLKGDRFPFKAIRHPNLSSWALENVINKHNDNMSMHDESMVGLAVQHPNVSHHRIEWAANHENANIRAMVALRPDLDHHTYDKLERDPVKYVGAAARIGQWPRHQWTAENKMSIRGFLGNNHLTIFKI